jgi:tight adherence protein C
MVIFFISAAITGSLLIAVVITLLVSSDPVEERLMEISSSSRSVPGANTQLLMVPTTGLGRMAAEITNFLKPVRALISGSDSDLEYKLAMAGFRKPHHVEIFTAIKMLLPLLATIAGTFFGDNMLAAILVGAVGGFFVPDLVLSYLVTRRQEQIRLALPDALDLLVICMEAGLGIDQAMVRVGEEMTLIAPALAEEFQIINLEQRAGKPRLDAWRSMAARLDIEFIRQFVVMLVQTERFGTPIAQALGVFADSLRMRRTQAAEEQAAKAGIKLLFPLVIFIFPSIFLVTLGPAVLNFHKMMQDMGK